MLVFRTISVTGEKSLLERLINELPLTDGWQKITKDRIAFPIDGTLYSFSAPHNGDREACTVWFHTDAAHDTLELSNIVPEELGQLSKQQYNAIVDEFYSKFIAPTSKTLSLYASMGPESRELEDFFDGETAQKLRTFSLSANKSTGSGHPLDRKRWIDFILSAFRNRTQVTGGKLIDILSEELNWPVDIAHSLAAQYDLARDVLEQFSEK